jgi:hypothetical protein
MFVTQAGKNIGRSSKFILAACKFSCHQSLEQAIQEENECATDVRTSSQARTVPAPKYG